jgi:hypothetical protein
VGNGSVNPEERGPCEANTSFSDWEVVFGGRERKGLSSIDQIGSVAQPFLVAKPVSKIAEFPYQIVNISRVNNDIKFGMT